MSPQSLTKLPISLLALLSLTSFVHGDCYVAAYGLVAKQDGYSACPGTATSPGGVETCCIPGSECGEDSICRSPNGGNNEWYVSGCTDPNYNDPLCTKNCGSYSTTFIQYDDNSQDWMCCGNGGCNGTVTDDTFSGPSPEDWEVVTGSSSSSSAQPSTTTSQSSGAASTSNTQATTTGTAASPSTGGTAASATSGASQSNNDGGLSTGAQVGIGVGIGLAGLALIVGLIAIFMIKKRNKKNRESTPVDEVHEKMGHPPSYAPYPPYSSDSGAGVNYAQSGAQFSEPIHSNSNPANELPANPPVFEVGADTENEVRHKWWRPQ